MLRTIQSKNFKCFTDFKLDVRALTLLTGFNGAGKSSSLQPLLLISQALRDGARAPVLSLNGPLVHLGSAGDVVAEGVRGPVELGFTTEKGDFAAWLFVHDRDLKRGELRLVGSQSSPSSKPSPGWLPTTGAHELLGAVRDVIFVGATRGPHGEAQAFPESPSVVVGDVGAEGQWAGYWYIQCADDDTPEARRHPQEERVTVRGQIDAWMSDLFPQSRVNAEQLIGLSLAKTTFALGGGNEWRRPSNVGYGLSYAFPIIVALVCSAPGQIVVVDSPEAHLHPQAQSAMGRMLAHFAAGGVQVIVESHSDHLLSGLRLAVRSGRLKPGDAAIHFFGKAVDDDEAEPRRRIAVEADGTLSQWPRGFFDQAMTDLVSLS